MRPIPALLFAAIVAAGCDHSTPTSSSTATPSTSASVATSGSRVLATVNGVPITEADVAQRARTGTGHGTGGPVVPTPATLETVIREELVRQKALQLGYDKDPSYQLKRDEMVAQLNTFERRELGELFFQKEGGAASQVSDADARAYFEKNAKMVQAELHLEQILFHRDELAAQATLDDLKAGKSFDELAKPHYPPQTADKRPWDLGFLKWNQMPEQWLPVVFELKPGETTGLIKGGENRIWILKLVERRDDAKVSFDEMKPRIVSVLGRTKAEEARTKALDEMRGTAKIVYSNPAPTPAPSASVE